jgi:chromosome segregation ATPase
MHRKLSEIIETLKQYEQNVNQYKQDLMKLKFERAEKEIELDDLIIDVKYETIITDERYQELNDKEKDIYLKNVVKQHPVINKITDEINKLSKEIANLEWHIETLYIEIRYLNDLLTYGLYEADIPEDEV